MPAFTYVGHNDEHIVGVPAGHLSAEEFDALDYDLQQAVYLNRGSDEKPLYVQVTDPDPEELIADDEPEFEVEPESNPPLDVEPPAEGEN